MDWISLINYLVNNQITMIGFVSSILMTVSTIAMAIIAFIALNSWKKQISVQNNLNITQKILTSMFKLRKSFSQIRRKMIFPIEEERGAEFALLMGETNLSKDQKLKHIYYTRWQSFITTFEEFENIVFENEIYISSDFLMIVDKFKILRDDLSENLLLYINSIGKSEVVDNAAKINNMYEIIFSDFRADSNKFTKRINESIASMKALLKNKNDIENL